MEGGKMSKNNKKRQKTYMETFRCSKDGGCMMLVRIEKDRTAMFGHWHRQFVIKRETLGVFPIL
jgi:hypothetical protein